MNEPKQIPGFIYFCNSVVSDLFTENTVGEGDAEARLVIGNRPTHVRHTVGMEWFES